MGPERAAVQFPIISKLRLVISIKQKGQVGNSKPSSEGISWHSELPFDVFVSSWTQPNKKHTGVWFGSKTCPLRGYQACPQGLQQRRAKLDSRVGLPNSSPQQWEAAARFQFALTHFLDAGRKSWACCFPQCRTTAASPQQPPLKTSKQEVQRQKVKQVTQAAEDKEDWGKEGFGELLASMAKKQNEPS
ncbi:hypothetical protein HispidOSU_031117 [Sigmodon hispidus]